MTVFFTRTSRKRCISLTLVVLLVALASALRAEVTESFTFASNRAVPDGDQSGLEDVQNVNSAIGTMTDIKVRLKITGEFNGDLYAYLRHSKGFTVLLNRPGKTDSDPLGYFDSGFDVTFETGAKRGDVHLYREATKLPDGSPLTGSWEPDGRDADPDSVTAKSERNTTLKDFIGLSAEGEWTLFVADVDSGLENVLTDWGLDISGLAYPTISWANPLDIVYGTALDASQLNATALYNSEPVKGAFSYAPDIGTVLQAGVGQTLSVTFTPEDTSSFLPVTREVTINVLKAALTITADDKQKLYGASLPSFTATYSGFVNGDTSASLSTSAAVSTTATSSSPVGSYPITASGAASPNYTFSYVPGTLTVTPAAIVVTASDKSKVYGASLPALTAVYSGFVLGQGTTDLSALATLSTTATSSSPVGSYPITASGAASPNYTFSYVPGTLAITQSLSSGVVTSSANPALPGADVILTMNVSAVSPGAGLPSGTVNFRIDGSIVGSSSLSAGLASITLNTLSHGAHAVVAEYAGNLNFVGTTKALTPVQVINTPPVAGNLTIERYPSRGVKVRLSTLLAAASDADLDELAITVDSMSANGGIVRLANGFVSYSPPEGFTNDDSFTFTITDGQGGSAEGTVTVAIKSNLNPGENLTITNLGDGSVRIDGSGIPERTYLLQFTETLSGDKWQDVPDGKVTADSFGEFEFIDTPGSGQRFYRTVYP